MHRSVSSFSESFPRLLPRSSTIVNFAREVTSALPCRASSKKFPTRFVTLPRHNGARDPSLKLPAIQIADSIQRGNGEYTFEKRRFCPRFLSPTRVSRRVCAPLPFLPSPRLSTSPIVRDFRTPPRDKFSHLPYSSPPCENQTNSFSFSPLFCFKFDLAVNDITMVAINNGDGRDYMFLRVQW